MTHAVIMAGGSGTRFWPKSRSSRPKQFLNLLGERSLLQMTVDRIRADIPEERTMVVTGKDHQKLVREQLPDLPDHRLIAEPVARNTAPCIAAAARLLLEEDPDAVMIVLPADHQITDRETFRNVLSAAVEFADRERSLVTIGIRPDRPETGYGYIHCQSDEEEQVAGRNVHRVLSFREKPDLETARQFLDSGDYLWNSGMFVWRADVIMEAFEKYQPEIYQSAYHLVTEPRDRGVERFFDECPSISIDYAVMENAERVHVLPADVGWSDMGSWLAAHELTEKDDAGNAVNTELSILIESSRNLVQTDNNSKLVTLVGVEHLAVIDTEEILMICDLDRSQKVKDVVEQLKKRDELRKFL